MTPAVARRFISRSGPASPLTLALGSTQLSGPARVKISRISALSVRRIGRRLGAASPEDVARVLEGLNEILGA